MSKLTTAYLLLLTTVLLGAEERVNIDDIEGTRSDDTFKTTLETGINNDYWNPGLQKDIIKYDTEGLFLWHLKAKFKLNQTDIASVEYYTSVDNKDKLKESLEEFKADKEKTTFMEGFYISIHTLKLLDDWFDTDIFHHINFEFDKRYFVGNGTLTGNTAFWYGEKEAQYNNGYKILHKGDILSFKTKFDSYKVYYTYKNNQKDAYMSIGAFDMSWSKPTFLNDSIANGRIPVTYDATYNTTGITANIGKKWKNLDIKAFVDYGIDNNIEVASDIDVEGDLQMFIAGVNADFKVFKLYSNDILDLDVMGGAYAQFTRVGQEYGDTKLDGEFNYGFKTGLALTF